MATVRAGVSKLSVRKTGFLLVSPDHYLGEVITHLPPNAAPEQAAALPPARIAAERHEYVAPERPEQVPPRVIEQDVIRALT